MSYTVTITEIFDDTAYAVGLQIGDTEALFHESSHDTVYQACCEIKDAIFLRYAAQKKGQTNV